MKENEKKKTVIAGEVIIVICFAVFALMSGRNSSENRIEELLDLGNKHLTEQDYEQAVVTYREVIEIDPKCEEAYHGLADAYVEMNDYESAIDILQQGTDQTGSEELAAYLEEIKKAYLLMQEEAALESEETEAGENNLLYYELGFSPEDFKIAGYSVMDGDHIDDVLHAAAEILPHEDDVAFDWEYDGWTYYSTELPSVNLGYYTPRFGKWYVSPVSYSPNGDGFMIFVSGETFLDMNLPANDPANEFPLYEGPIIPDVTSYEEGLDNLGIRLLIQALDSTEADESGYWSLEFESQYGTGYCWKYEEVPENEYMEMGIISYSLQSGKSWSLDFWIEDNTFCMVRITNSVN